MPRNDEFDEFDEYEADDVEVLEPEGDIIDEIAAARALVAAADAKRLGKTDAAKPQRNRAQRRARPANAPEPQDRKPKRAIQAREADPEDELVFTIFDREYRIRRGDLAESWDYTAAVASENPPKMVMATIGQRGFALFAADAKRNGIKPDEGMKMFFEAFAEEMGMTPGES